MPQARVSLQLGSLQLTDQDEVGIVGCAVFGGILLWASTSLLRSISLSSLFKHVILGQRGDMSLVRVAFFSSTWLCAALELPRYAALALGEPYAGHVANRTQKAAYSCHLTASVFFFASFSLILAGWNHLLIGHQLRLLSREVLITVNVVFACLAAANIVMLNLMPGTLLQYFLHPMFTVFSFSEALKNVVYSICALICIKRIGAYQELAKVHSGDADTAHLSAALRRLKASMLVCSCCFFLRVAMVVIKLCSLHDWILMEDPLTLFTLKWFTLSDLVSV